MMYSYEQFITAKAKDRVYGDVLIKGYTIKPNSSGMGKFIAGTIEAKGSIPFKVWDTDPAFKQLEDVSYINKEVCISGEINVYNGSQSIIIQAVKNPENPATDKSVYYTTRYDLNDLLRRMTHIVETYLSENAQKAFLALWNPIKERMCLEFAAVSHHDNCLHGLLAHTVKTASLAVILLKNYTQLKKGCQDGIVLGALLHDVGKIYTYDWGYYSPTANGLSHNVLGVQYLVQRKDDVLQYISQETYNLVLSVIEQHHGQYGEPPKTLAAYIVHVADMLDARITDVEEQILSPNFLGTVRADDWVLHLPKEV